MTQEFNNQKAFTFQKSSKEISEDYTVIMPTRLWILSQSNNKTAVSLKKKRKYLVHINGRKHVLEHGGHEFDVHALRWEVVEDEQRMVRELLLVHSVLLQSGDDVFDEGVLQEKEESL